MQESIPVQLRFPPIAGLTVRGDFDGGAMSSDFGPLILRGVDRQIGLIERLAAAFDDQRHPWVHSQASSTLNGTPSGATASVGWTYSPCCRRSLNGPHPAMPGWAVSSSSVPSCTHNTTRWRHIRSTLQAQCGVSTASQSTASCASSRQAACVSAQPPQATGMLALLMKKIKQLEQAMAHHARDLEFEEAAKLRDEI